MLIQIFNENKSGVLEQSESRIKIAALLQLFQEMTKMPTLRQKIQQLVHPEVCV
jgi:hypothetical protein